ncbi:MAG: 50S ribosomal protein L11 methyltransferase [Gammaproteobacteria bacterium]
MAWLQLEMELDGLDPEAVEDALLEAGALSVTLQDAADQPIFEPAPGTVPLWQSTRLTGLFDAEQDMDAVRALLLARLGRERLPGHRIEPLEDRDWTREWLRDFRPMRFGRRLWVCPTGFESPDPDGVVIALDPGLAFGTGTHATTALCLEWLEGLAWHGQTVIDYGCGSGILAVAAALLGAGAVWAVDNDPQALVATRANAQRNGVAERIHAVLPEDLPAVSTPVLVANILAGPLVALAAQFADRVADRGRIALSGLLPSQVAMVDEAYAPWFDMQPAVQREDWMLLTGSRRPR